MELPIACHDCDLIHLSPDLFHIMVTARLIKDANEYLTKNTRFWVVRARVVGSSVSGLGTHFSGEYIDMDPGKPGGKATVQITAPVRNLDQTVAPAATATLERSQTTLSRAIVDEIEKACVVP